MIKISLRFMVEGDTKMALKMFISKFHSRQQI